MKQSILFLLIGLLAVSCKDSKKHPLESEKPVITIVSQSTPTVSEYLCDALFDNVLKVGTGDTLRLTFFFRAENQLAQYKIDAHNNFDCHAHGKSMNWSVLKVADLTGMEATVEEELIIPENASAGNYHLMIRLLDVYGYEAEVKEFNVIIHNSEDEESPAVTLISPAENGIYHQGDAVHFQGTITDNLSLESSRYELKFTDAGGQTYNLYEVFYSQGTTTVYTIDTSYTIGPFIAPGAGYFTIKAYDQANNFSLKVIPVIIE
ncbi:hypothetical protein D3C87_200440 [compost metagenome]